MIVDALTVLSGDAVELFVMAVPAVDHPADANVEYIARFVRASSINNPFGASVVGSKSNRGMFVPAVVSAPAELKYVAEEARVKATRLSKIPVRKFRSSDGPLLPPPSSRSYAEVCASATGVSAVEASRPERNPLRYISSKSQVLA